MFLSILGICLILTLFVLGTIRAFRTYFRTSSRRDTGGGARPMVAILALGLFAIGTLTGCTDFERTSFQSLSASKAVIDQAQVDYEARTIPHVQASFDAITKAKQAQTTAVDAMIAYEQIKAAKGDASSLQVQQQIVTAALAQLVPLIADIKLLIAPVKVSSLPYAPRSWLATRIAVS